jgi:hypothetical protein
LKVDTGALVDFNLIPDVMCAGLHNNVPVDKGQVLAGTRAIPLVIDRGVLDRAVALAADRGPIFSVAAYCQATAFDLLLPRLLAGENSDHRDLARMAVGGLCLNCETCRYPACSFGKS